MLRPTSGNQLTMRVVSLAAVFLLAYVFLAVGAGAGAQAPDGASRAAGTSTARLSWSDPFSVEQFGVTPLKAVACPSTSLCVTLDADGRAISFDPLHPATRVVGLLDPTGAAAAISCPAANECVALYEDGNAYTFNPASPAAFIEAEVDQQAATSDGAGTLALSCPTSALCVDVDDAGDLISFDPAAMTATLKTTNLLDGVKGGLISVSCYPRGSQCTAIGLTQELTFNPTDPSGAVPHTVVNPDAGNLSTVVCPSASECIAADYGGAISFDPQSPVASAFLQLDGAGTNELKGLSCQSDTACVYADKGGRAITFDPQSDQVLLSQKVDAVSASALACASSSACEIVDGDGGAVAFNPAVTGIPSRTTIHSGSPLTTLSCPTVSECVASTGDQTSAGPPDNIVRFDPAARRTSSTHPLFKSSGLFLAGLDCPTRSLCTAVVGDREAIFNPIRFSYPGNGENLDPDSDEGISYVSCPLATECVEVDANGWAVSFRPHPFGYIRHKISVETGESLKTLACPSSGDCVAVDDDGRMISFDPLNGLVNGARKIDAPVGLDAASGDSDNSLDAISCPLRTRCVATDTLGNIVTFNPLASRGAELRSVDPHESLNAIACPRAGLCIAVDGAGHAVVGNPATNTWKFTTVPGAASLLSIACPSQRACVVTDSLGDELSARVGAGA